MFLNTEESKVRNDAGLADSRSILDEYVEQYLNNLHEIDEAPLKEWRRNLAEIRSRAKKRVSGH